MPKLVNVIEDLLASADASAPEPARVRLTHGLGISLKRDGAAYVLTIYRVGGLPSMREWNVVCSSFPYDVPVSTPTSGVHKSYHYFQDRIPAHPKVTGFPQMV